MIGWVAVLGGCLACFAPKLLGHVLPSGWLTGERVARLAGFVTIALLSALCAVQTLGSGQGLGVDARVPALAVAALLLWRRAPFVVVVVAAALTAAGLRALTG